MKCLPSSSPMLFPFDDMQKHPPHMEKPTGGPPLDGASAGGGEPAFAKMCEVFCCWRKAAI